ncbi:hypothetical protein K4L06_13685 [Lysobacter sp. BMK333-48F3]|uniref:hypothetical protein n=1 Tax=Lysobacter sp. BMK333-48F3 TaxID=2867962 RepID=UPI001C8B92B4|nr:hypothetical protein [Lysobacter sp. BMK333-48F3]MBX9402361.1 hypothetical protein [Lysobacter sp. BMK333-48F3]
MNETRGYAVFFFPQALEVLGDAIRPYLLDGPVGPHLLCREIDTGGAFTEMTLEGRDPDGRVVSLELMVPGSMVRMIVSAHGEGSFGFGSRLRGAAPAAPGAAQAGAPPSGGAAAAPATPDAPATPNAAGQEEPEG